MEGNQWPFLSGKGIGCVRVDSGEDITSELDLIKAQYIKHCESVCQ